MKEGYVNLQAPHVKTLRLISYKEIIKMSFRF
jgi:hypothetical protein